MNKQKILLAQLDQYCEKTTNSRWWKDAISLTVAQWDKLADEGLGAEQSIASKMNLLFKLVYL